MKKKIVKVEINQELGLAAFWIDESSTPDYFSFNIELYDLETLEKKETLGFNPVSLLNQSWETVDFEQDSFRTSDQQFSAETLRLLKVDEAGLFRVVAVRWEIYDRLENLIDSNAEEFPLGKMIEYQFEPLEKQKA